MDKHNAPDLQERIGGMKAEIVALKHFVMDEIVSVKNSVENGNLLKSNHDPRLIEILLDEIKYLREENENKNSIIKTLAENQKQLNREDQKISSQEKKYLICQTKKLTRNSQEFTMNLFIQNDLLKDTQLKTKLLRTFYRQIDLKS